MKYPPALIALAVLVLAPGCLLSRESLDEPIEPSLLEQLEPGVSSAADVVALLGAPDEVVQLGRRSAYRFDYSTTKRAGVFLIVVGVFNSDTRQDRVWAFFDENDHLTHLGVTLDSKNVAYAMPWVDLHK